MRKAFLYTVLLVIAFAGEGARAVFSGSGIVCAGGRQIRPVSDSSARFSEPGGLHTWKVTIYGADYQFVRVPAGTFTMGSQAGSPEARPAHTVNIPRSFHIGRTEVTVRQFRAFVNATGYKPAAAREESSKSDAEPSDGRTWLNPGFQQSEDDPVTCVSWEDAQAFCRWFSEETGLACRLPTEAEWEYACRPDLPNDPAETAWYRANSGGRTHRTGEKKPNIWGIYDMRGNVWEWCLDTWHQGYEGAPRDGSPWVSQGDSLRVLRGGSWWRPASSATATSRHHDAQWRRTSGYGFRMVALGRNEPLKKLRRQ